MTKFLMKKEIERLKGELLGKQQTIIKYSDDYHDLKREYELAQLKLIKNGRIIQEKNKEIERLREIEKGLNDFYQLLKGEKESAAQ